MAKKKGVKIEMEWYDDYERTLTIPEKVWQILQTVPTDRFVFADQITKQVNKDKNFTETKARRIREALQDLLLRNKIKLVGTDTINGRRVKLFQRVEHAR
tara:strand:+ start:70 stop:369 length:300 start_codon:yes stop_codon:yes gene_type:complete